MLSAGHLQLGLHPHAVQSKTLPILLYHCKVWFGTCCRDSTRRQWAEAAEQVHRDFMHGISGVSCGAPTAAVLAQFVTYPLVVYWARIATRFRRMRMQRTDQSAGQPHIGGSYVLTQM